MNWRIEVLEFVGWVVFVLCFLAAAMSTERVAGGSVAVALLALAGALMICTGQALRVWHRSLQSRAAADRPDH